MNPKLNPKLNRIRFDEAAEDLKTEYAVDGRRSADELERRIRLHLLPYVGSRRHSSIPTADVRSIAHRQDQGVVAAKGPRTGERVHDVSTAEINRELTALKRMFTLAVQADKPLRRPHIPLLEERNTRTGFFELDMLRAVVAKLPKPLRPVMTFACITGWRITSEVLPLEWKQVGFPPGRSAWIRRRRRTAPGECFPCPTISARSCKPRQPPGTH